jgi:hypothetical protein
MFGRFELEEIEIVWRSKGTRIEVRDEIFVCRKKTTDEKKVMVMIVAKMVVDGIEDKSNGSLNNSFASRTQKERGREKVTKCLRYEKRSEKKMETVGNLWKQWKAKKYERKRRKDGYGCEANKNKMLIRG